MFFLIIGILLLIAGFADIIYTAFSSRGAGFITKVVSRSIWNVMVTFRNSTKNDKLLLFAGPVIMCITLIQWVGLLWLGNVFLVVSSESSVVNSQTKTPATLLEKVYYIGYTLSSLGNGDFMGGSSFWKIYAAIISFTGFVVLTVIITYLVQVLSTVSSKRKLSSYIAALGDDPENILVNAWNGKDFSRLNVHLQQLSSQVFSIDENHLSYPVLHYYYSTQASKSLSVTITVLDETLTLLYGSVPKPYWPDPLLMQVARRSVTAFLNTLKEDFIKPANELPPPASINKLAENNIPLYDSDQINEHYSMMQDRRKLLLGFLKDEGRKWCCSITKE